MEEIGLVNPADRPLTTFDANIVITLRNNEADTQPIRQLLALNHAGVITVNVTLSTALEEQRPEERKEMHEYASWLQEHGIAPGNIFTGPRTVGFHLPGDPPDTITFDPRLEIGLNMRIHAILFPNIPFRWVEYRDQECRALGIEGTKREALLELDRQALPYIPHSPQAPARRPTPALDALGPVELEEVRELSGRLHRKWMNAKNDALGLYNYISQAMHTTHPEQAVFVTNDRNFFKQKKAAHFRELGLPGKILRPDDAVAFLQKVTGTA